MAKRRDRIDRAWELRRDVYAWIEAHPMARMPQVKAAFAQRKPETVREVVRRLALAGCVVCVDLGYRVTDTLPADPETVRARMAMVGRSNAAKLAQMNRSRARKTDGTFAPIPAIVSPGRYVNRPASKQAISNQGGQGVYANVGRRRDMVL